MLSHQGYSNLHQNLHPHIHHILHLELHNTISKLKHQGLGYRKISKKLNEMGIKSVTGKIFYPSLVSNMWRTIKRREEKLNREIISEYYDFDIVFVPKV